MGIMKKSRRRRTHLLLLSALLGVSGPWTTARAADSGPELPPAPAPERIQIHQLALPPNPEESGACGNPTGCISSGQAGGFLPDSRAVSAMLTYAGAPAAPDPASVYNGNQIVLLKTDGSTFPNGQTVKCLTCGMPDDNKKGMNALPEEPYPMPFRDGLSTATRNCPRTVVRSAQ